MSTTKRRQRRPRNQQASVADVQQPAGPLQVPVSNVQPMPDWKWRTFPVFFALSLGLFIGTWAGGLSGFVAGDDGNQMPLNVVWVVSAIFMGLALSRFMTRFLISRQWIKPKPKPVKRR